MKGFLHIPILLVAMAAIVIVASVTVLGAKFEKGRPIDNIKDKICARSQNAAFCRGQEDIVAKIQAFCNRQYFPIATQSADKLKGINELRELCNQLTGSIPTKEEVLAKINELCNKDFPEIPGADPNYSSIIKDIKQHCANRTASPTPTPIPEQNKISWQTPQVSLEADNFYILINDKKFLGNVENKLHSDPGNTTYTTLEVEWTENGIPMRFYMYFEANNDTWSVSEIRTYNGKNPGDWIFYDGFLGGKPGNPYINKVLDIKSKPVGSYNVPGEIHFENIKLLPFRNQ